MMTFWEFVNERHSIYLRRKAGDKPPWTDDPILQQYYFCNIFRELDKTTIWFRKNIREPLNNSPEVIMATVIFRWFNRIETAKTMPISLFTQWDSDFARERLRHLHPVVTGAYMIKSPTGMNKLDGLCWAIDQMWQDRKRLISIVENAKRLQDVWNVFRRYPFQGPFISYEVVTDLRHTSFLNKAEDIMTWANIGPGAYRGLNYMGVPPTITSMQGILLESFPGPMKDSLWKHPIKMEMRDIEHSLCEYAKYRNALEGKRLKRRYNGNPS